MFQDLVHEMLKNKICTCSTCTAIEIKMVERNGQYHYSRVFHQKAKSLEQNEENREKNSKGERMSSKKRSS